MQNVKLRLDAWRDAERRRDGLAIGSSEWQEAEEEVRSAAKVFLAEVAQASVRYAETDFQDRNRTFGAGRWVADAAFAELPRSSGPGS
jgi:hypothetical protein